MVAIHTEMSEAEIADWLRSCRTVQHPDYTERDREDVSPADRYEAHSHHAEAH